MATEIGKGVIPVTFDKDQIGRDLHRSFDDGARSAEGGIGSTFKRLAGVATAAFAGVQVFSAFKGAVDAAREAEKVAAQSEAVIKSTGGAANLTADQFSKLAESISMKTGIDDEQIQSAENLLATFTNLRNEVGDGNDIFSQATKIAVDMGAALGGDASSNAIQLGKALNDPIRGISALTRVGVTFTDEQRNLIKTLQESGDVAGAQKVILSELNKEFGGSAEATATAGDKFSVFFGNLQEKVGGFLIPLLDSLATWAMTTLPDAFGVLQDTVGPIIESVTGVVSEFIYTLTSGFTEDEGTDVEAWALGVRDAIGLLIVALQAIAGFITGTVVPALVSFGQWLWDNKPVLEGVAVAVGVLLVGAFVSWAASAAVAAIATWAAFAPIIAIGLVIAALAAGVIYAYQQWDWFRNTVDTVASFLKETLLPALSDIATFLRDTFNKAIAFGKALWDNWGPSVIAVKDAMVDLFGKLGTVFKIALDAHNIAMGTALQVWKNLEGPVSSILNLLLQLIEAAGKAAAALREIPGLGGGGGALGILGSGGGSLLPGPFGTIADFLFDEGGTVPGPVGMPHLAVVHGGELVLTPEQQRGGGGNTYQIAEVAYVNDPEDIAVGLRRAELLAGVS